MTYEPVTLGDRICEARESKEFTVSQLARRLGVKTDTLKNWESGRSEPRPNRLVMLAGMLDVPVSWLIEGAAEHKPTHISATKADMVAQKLERAAAMHAELGNLLAEIAEDVSAIQCMEAELEELAA